MSSPEVGGGSTSHPLPLRVISQPPPIGVTEVGVASGQEDFHQEAEDFASNSSPSKLVSQSRSRAAGCLIEQQRAGETDGD